jgi:exodeoxyribonuclease VII large subunit
VVLVPAAVQGAGAPVELVDALESLYDADLPVDVILLVRGGGSIEDLWAFNDETLARTIVRSPVPLVCGVGHETDFTIADFCADVRAPTPTAAAELVAAPRDLWLGALDLMEERLGDALARRMDVMAQRLDLVTGRLGRPSGVVARQQVRLAAHAQRLRHAVGVQHARAMQSIAMLTSGLPQHLARDAHHRRDRLDRVEARLKLLDPALVLQRGYAWLTDAEGRTVTRAKALSSGDAVMAQLADGTVGLTVREIPIEARRPTQGE